MKNFKAISMDCNEQQFESMREELIGLGCDIVALNLSVVGAYLVNNFTGFNMKITTLYYEKDKTTFDRQYIGAFDKEAFLQACGKVEEVKESGWYISTLRNKWMMYIDFEEVKKFGFDIKGYWGIFFNSNDRNATKATNEQVLQRLTEEAEKRGYKEGVKVIDLNKVEIVCRGSFVLGFSGELHFGGATIMKNGIWADIVPNDIEVVEPEVKTCGLANDIINSRKEQDKKLDSAVKSRNMYKHLYEKEKSKREALGEKDDEINRLKNDVDSLENYNVVSDNAYNRRLKIKERHIDNISKLNNEICYENENLEKKLKETRKEINQLSWCFYGVSLIAIFAVWWPTIKLLF